MPQFKALAAAFGGVTVFGGHFALPPLVIALRCFGPRSPVLAQIDR